MEQNSEKVVLVHGVSSHRSVMWPIAYRLWREGFRAETWSYITFFRSISGSPVARFIAKLSRRMIVPARELSDQPGSYANQIKTTNAFEIGVLAAKYDFLVPSANTHLPNETCHRILPATHNSLLVSRTATQLIVHFLRNGKFSIP